MENFGFQLKIKYSRSDLLEEFQWKTDGVKIVSSGLIEYLGTVTKEKSLRMEMSLKR